jgi:hypothetical protein
MKNEEGRGKPEVEIGRRRKPGEKQIPLLLRRLGMTAGGAGSVGGVAETETASDVMKGAARFE